MSDLLILISGRAILAYILLLILSLVLGRKALSQMTFFDFIVGITIGTITASIALGTKYTPLGAAVALIIFGLATYIIDIIHIKSFKMRKLVNSEPIVLIKNGKIIEDNLKRVLFSLENLQMQLRKKNIFNIADVEFAVAETDGKLSVLKKSQKQPLTPSDLNLATDYKGLTIDVILDGEIMEENLKAKNLDEDWVTCELNKRGIKDIDDVFYAGLDTAGNLYVSLRNKKEEEEGEYGLE